MPRHMYKKPPPPILWCRIPCPCRWALQCRRSTPSTTVFRLANDPRCLVLVTSVDGRRSSVMPSRIRAIILAPAARDRLSDVCSVECLKNEDLAKGMAHSNCLFECYVTNSTSSYIKELADRIHSIENKLENDGGLSQDDLDHLFVPERARQNHVGGDDASRKRPFSSISGEFTTPAPTRQTPWGSEQRALQPSSTASDGYASAFNTGSLAPQPSAIKPDSTPSKPPVAIMEISMTDADPIPDIDEENLHR